MRRWRWLLIPLMLVALVGAGVFYVLESAWTREKLRTRIITEVDKATGGKTSMNAFDFDWRALKFTSSEFVLRGTEGPEQAPFVRAGRVRVGLTVRSWWQENVELTEVVVEKPEVHIYVRADGSTNVPTPKIPRKPGGAPLEDLIRLKIGRLEIKNGVFEYDSRHVPFSVLAQGLDAKLTYDKLKPRYLVALTGEKVRLPGEFHPRVEMVAALEANRVELERVRAFVGDSVVEFAGAIVDFRHPKVDGQVRSSVLLRDIQLSPIRQGFGTIAGTLHYSAERGFLIDGRVQGEQLAYSSKEFKLSRGRINSDFHLTTSLLKLSGVTVQTPLGDWKGDAVMREWRGFALTGEATRVDLDALQAAFVDRPYAWSGTVRGPLSLQGELTEKGLRKGLAEAELSIVPKDGEIPMSGKLDLAWSQESGKLDFGSSYLATEAARVNFHGMLGERLEVGFYSTRVRDLEPVIAMLRHEDAFHLPLQLQGGEARFNGVITGTMENLDIKGQASLINGVYEGILFERAAADLHVTKSQVDLSGVELRSDMAEATGSVRVGLADWSMETGSALTAKLRVTQMDAQRLLKIAKVTAPISGTIDATVEAGGTLGAPVGQVQVGVMGAAWEAEKFGDLKGRMALDLAGALQGTTEFEGAKVEVTGNYQHPPGDFDDGEVRLKVTVAGLELQKLFF